MIDWPRIACAFEWDGGLRDIYVPNAAVADWQLVWKYLRQRPDRLTLKVDDLAVDLPIDVETIFALRTGHSVTAGYVLGGLDLRCHFFDETEIEFDLDPREVDATRAGSLEGFMIDLGTLLSKPVILTAENEREAVIARCDPASMTCTWVTP